MTTILSRLKARSVPFLRNDRGASAIEYGLIAAGIAIAIATTVGSVGTNINGMFTKVVTATSTSTTTTP